MGPIRKSKSLNTRFSKLNEVSPVNHVGGDKSKQLKKKASDMLGSQWSREELGRFYEAFRKYRTDWKKVASVVRSRSVEMVEALYNMNRAYLSLPEGTASVVGLIAMMTDHYNILEDGSESERESKDDPEICRKTHKRAPAKFQSISKGLDEHVQDSVYNRSAASSSGCLSLLKKRSFDGSQPRIVGKRTPRFPVSYKGYQGKCVSPNKPDSKSEEYSNIDDVAHGVLALKKPFQSGHGQVSQTPNRRIKHMRSSTFRNCAEANADAAMVNTKRVGEAERGRARNSTDKMEYQKKQKQFHVKKPKHQGSGINHFDDVTSVKDKADAQATYTQFEPSSLKQPKKKSRQLVFEDESLALDGLHALANALIDLEPASAFESDPSIRVKEKSMSLDITDTSKRPEAMDRQKITWPKQKRNHGMGAVLKIAEVGRDPDLNVGPISEAKQWPNQPTLKRKRKHKSVASKLQYPDAESQKGIALSEQLKTEASSDARKKSMNNSTGDIQSDSPPKQGKPVRLPESSSSSANPLSAGNHSAVPVVPFSTINQVNLPTKLRSRRKMHLPKALVGKELNSVESAGKDRRYEFPSSLHNRAHDPKEKISHCLSSQTSRRWCAFEWFYSAVDYPWFAKSDFVEYLNHVGLGHVPRLTRVEWSVIRSSLGKPRRLSSKFLKEEKEKLEKYRECVRTHYTELRTGSREVHIPSDLALPLSVGQRVIACHPKTRGIHDGSILTVERNRCRVRFDRPELGVEFVMDIDCMPLDPLGNMPYALRRHDSVNIHESFKDYMKVRPADWKVGGNIKFARSENMEDANSLLQISSPSYFINTSLKQTKGYTGSTISHAKATSGEINHALLSHAQPCNLSQIQAREADIQALAKLSRALGKKEVLVLELRDMNCEVLKRQSDGNNSLKDSELFRKQYATVIVQLKEVNEQVSSALMYLRQRNTYQESSPPAWPKLLASSRSSIDRFGNLPAQESGSTVVEVVESSRLKARKMVEVATQAMSALKEGEDALKKIGEALDFANSRHYGADPSCPDFPNQDQSGAVKLEPMTTLDGTASKPTNASKPNEAQIPSALISSCVATLLMIQACAQRQYPPADAARILDSAITSLKPCCSQNIPIYREIEMCMGMVKNQILALVPT